MHFDPMSAAFAADPFPIWSRLRAADAPVWSDAAGAWIVSRFGDVDELVRNPAMVRSMEAFMTPEEIASEKKRINWHNMPNHEAYVQFSLLEADGALHRRLRQLVIGVFTRSFVERHRTMITDRCATLLAPLIGAGEVDFIDAFAAHFPGHIIGTIIGVPETECPQLRRWSEQIVQFYNTNRTPDDKALAEKASEEFASYIKDLIKLRRWKPEDDLVSELVAAQSAGRIDERELISTIMLVLMAGHGSTIDVLGTGLLNLIRHPDEMTKLKSDPDTYSTAIQEMFRYEGPLPFFHRYAAQDVTVMGQNFPKGTKFGVAYASANRDPAAFVRADRFDVTRTPNRHLAFGMGAHLCLGNNLARLDMEVVFSMLLNKTKDVRLVGKPPQFKRGLSIRGLETLNVELQAA